MTCAPVCSCYCYCLLQPEGDPKLLLLMDDSKPLLSDPSFMSPNKGEVTVRRLGWAGCRGHRVTVRRLEGGGGGVGWAGGAWLGQHFEGIEVWTTPIYSPTHPLVCLQSLDPKPLNRTPPTHPLVCLLQLET